MKQANALVREESMWEVEIEVHDAGEDTLPPTDSNLPAWYAMLRAVASRFEGLARRDRSTPEQNPLDESAPPESGVVSRHERAESPYVVEFEYPPPSSPANDDRDDSAERSTLRPPPMSTDEEAQLHEHEAYQSMSHALARSSLDAAWAASFERWASRFYADG